MLRWWLRESTCNVGDLGSILGLGRCPGEGNGFPLQYSGLENPMDRGAKKAMVHGVAKSRTWLNDFHFSLREYKHSNHNTSSTTFPEGYGSCFLGHYIQRLVPCMAFFLASCYPLIRASQVVLVVKNLPANAGEVRDVGSIPGSGRSPGGGCGNPLQYSCLENLCGQRSLVAYSPWGC